jgi:hypothetical protein
MFRCIPSRQSPILETQIDGYSTAHITVPVGLFAVSPAEDFFSKDISVLLDEGTGPGEPRLVEIDKLSGIRSMTGREPQTPRLVP